MSDAAIPSGDPTSASAVPKIVEPPAPSRPEKRARPARWHELLHGAAEAVFVLDRSRRLVYANPAWEALTGLSFERVRGLRCRSRGIADPDPEQVLALVLSPPRSFDALGLSRVRRRYEDGSAAASWWDIDYLSLHDEQGLLGLLGKIQPVAAAREGPRARIPEQLIRLRAEAAQRRRLGEVPTQSPAVRHALEQARLASQSAVPTLIVGEPGTGKQWLARWIHQQSAVREQTFAALDGARLPAAILADALWGEKGLLRRPTLGTLYLRQPSAWPRDWQLHLLAWLEGANEAQRARGGGVPRGTPRLLAGCVTEPHADVAAGTLLAELSFALGTLQIRLPPLRERREDLPFLIDHFLQRLQPATGRKISGLNAPALEMLAGHSWPGNLRELYEVLLDASLRADGGAIEPAHLQAYLRQAATLDALLRKEPERVLSLDAILERVERRLIENALRQARGNKARAAELLGIWRPRLLRRLEALGLAAPAPNSPPPAPTS